MEYKEIRLEEDIESYLLTSGGYTKGDQKTYDKDKAIDMDKLIAFIKATQPKQWLRYERNYNDDAEKKLYKRFNEEVNAHGLLHVIRNGINDRGVRLNVAYFKPESTLNPDVIERYNQNILTCTRQFRYSTSNNNSIDMVLSLNGIPIVALELKNQLTGQSVENGKEQFMYNRNPREKCFQFNTRFLIYFVVDHYDVFMTTELKGKDTYFLPFNQGSNGAGNVGGAGNPANPSGYTTSYLWEKALCKDVFMDILNKYMHLDVKTNIVIEKGKEKRKVSKRLIFPRYQQLDVVTKLLTDVKKRGSGDNYLIQHSAGSGKSNSIAWLAYGLANLHDDENKPTFTSVIVVSDRKVLDNQLQSTISGFDHTRGVIETIGEGKTSQDLLSAINDDIKIIVTTLQKFPVIYKDVDETKGKRFAIIVDEAHQSQTGSSAMKLKHALADTEDALREYAEIEGKAEEELEDGEDKLVKELLTHGHQSNLSYFAFTATPKKRTLEIFGKKQADGTFAAFHNYSMRQAIEEGFILDVLQNYMTYKTCYKISKDTEENPEIPSSAATKTIKRFAQLHPYTLGQKTAIIIEQFRANTKHKIGGRAKSMIVTPSRLHAVRYYHEFKKYIEKKGYDDIEVLVAFSGTVKDGDESYTEEGLNKRNDGTTIKEKQLPAEFSSDDFNMLVVAEKYQTGFDQPLLHTMFVDKKLSGIKAVQTLSRLNRIYPGKEDTFILDFVNKKEDIEEAFSPYYEATILDEEININLIYNTRTTLREFFLYDRSDVEKFATIYYKKKSQTATDLGKMTSLLKPVTAAYEKLNLDDQYSFKQNLRNFVKWYSYIIQIVRMYDKELHEEYVFLAYLGKLLPKELGISVDLENKLKLEFFKLEETFKGDISLDPTKEDETLENTKEINHEGGKPTDEEEFLEEIIDKVNYKYKGDFKDSDKVMMKSMSKKAYTGQDSEKLKKYALNNEEEVFVNSIFPNIFKRISQESYIESTGSYTKFFEDKEFYETAMEEIARELYRKFNG